MFIACLLVVSGIAPVATGLAEGEPALRGAASPQLTQENNTTIVRHENPDVRRDDQDLLGVQRWLSGRMGEVLVDCTEGAVADRTGVCDLNTTYPSYLERYVDLAGESNAERDDEAARVFEEADEHQRKFNNNTNDYQETKAAFEEANESNETGRQRELARELLRDARVLNQSSGVLLRDYENISRLTTADMENGTTAVRAVRLDAQETIELLETLYFNETELQARALSETATYTDPAPIQGRLTLANDTAIANRSIRLQVGGTRTTVRTNATGWFQTQYRPKFEPVGSSTVRLRYLPRNTSRYLGSETSVSVRIEPVEPTVMLDVRPSAAGFTDVVRLRGNVTVGGTAIRNVPVNLTVGAGRPVRVRTDDAGSFERRVRIPLTLDDGTQSVQASIPLERRAIGAASNRSALTVTTTETNLTLNGSTVEARNVVASGRLTTAAGPPAAGRQVRLLVDEEPVATTRTNASGHYRVPLSVPASAVNGTSNTSVRIVSAFDGGTTNLESSRAETVVVVAMQATETPTNSTDANVSASPIPNVEQLAAVVAQLPVVGGVTEGLGPWTKVAVTMVVVLFLLGLLAVLAVVALRWWRRGAESKPTATSSVDGGTDTAEPIEAIEAVDVETAAPPTLLELARERIQSGAPARGIEASYLAVRRDLEARLEPGNPQTHWEFYTTCAGESLTDEELAALEDLTQAYERAIFSPTGISAADADTALTTAGSLFDSLQQTV